MSRNAPTNNEASFPVFMGTKERLRAKVRRVEAERRRGFSPMGVVVKCQHVGCDGSVLINDEADLDRFERGELYCSTCKARDFYELPYEEQERRVRENLAFLGELHHASRCLGNEQINLLIHKCDERAKYERGTRKTEPTELEEEEIPFPY